MKKFEVGEVVIVSDFAGDPETIGVKAVFSGLTDDGKFLAKSMLKGKHIRKEPIQWEYCFKMSDAEA